MTTENQIYTNNGFVILVDGTTFLIERVQYSHNGISDWEDPPFNPIEHANSITGLGTLPGHKYRRTMLAGSTTWGMAEYIVAQDGKNIEFSQNDEYITWRYIGETTWNNLILKDELKGSQGLQGVEGKGLCISALGAFDTKPITPTTTLKLSISISKLVRSSILCASSNISLSLKYCILSSNSASILFIASSILSGVVT